MSKAVFNSRNSQATSWLLTILLLIVSVTLDYRFSTNFPLINLLYALPLVAAAVLMSPIETFQAGMLIAVFSLTAKAAAGPVDASDLLIAAAIAAAGITGSVSAAFIRRFFRRLSTPRQALKSSPLAFARFRFPGYQLLEFNEAFMQMATDPVRSAPLAACFPRAAAERLSELMDEAITQNRQTSCGKLQIVSGISASYWRVELIPGSKYRRAAPADLTLFALDVTEQAQRGRIREAALRISTMVQSSLDVDETARIVLDSLIFITGALAGGLFLLEDDQWERRAMVGNPHLGEGEPLRMRAPYDNLALGVRAVESRQVVIAAGGAQGEPAAEGLREPAAGRPPVKSGAARTSAYMVVPLIAGNKKVGAAWLDQMEPAAPFSRDQIEFAGIIGAHGALAIENASIYEKEQSARKSLEAIEAVSEVGLLSLDIEEILKELANRTQSVMRMDAAVILLLDDDGDFLELREMTGDSSCPAFGGRLMVGEGLAGRTFAANAPMKIDNLRDDPEACPLFKDSGLKSAMAVPLRLDGSPVGVLGIGSMNPAAFSVNDWELIQVIADRASLAVQNSRLHAQTRGELTKVELLRHIASLCASSLDIKEIAGGSLQEVTVGLGCRNASIYYLDKRRQALINLAFAGPQPQIIEHLMIRPLEENTMLVRAAVEQQMITSDDFDPKTMAEGDAFIIAGLSAAGNRMCTVPLIFKAETVGAMAMVFPDQKPFTPSTIDTLNSLANQLAVAVHSHLPAAAGAEPAGGKAPDGPGEEHEPEQTVKN